MEMQKFKELLDQEYEWPADYVYKFIASPDQVENVKGLCPGAKTSQRASASGKYIGVTIVQHAKDSEEVISVYEKAALINDVMIF